MTADSSPACMPMPDKTIKSTSLIKMASNFVFHLQCQLPDKCLQFSGGLPLCHATIQHWHHTNRYILSLIGFDVYL